MTAMIVTPEFHSRKHYFMPQAVQVDLVTSPAPKPHGTTPSSVSQTPPIESHLPAKQMPEKGVLRSEPKPRKTITETNKVALTKKPVHVKKSLKQRTFKPAKVTETAIERIKKELPQSRERQIVAAIDKLKEQVAIQEGVVQGAAGKAESLQLMDIYHAEIWHHIQKQWAFSNQLAQGKTNLEATIVAKIMKTGEIRDLWFEERSGNDFFDDSVLRAMKKASPLPPLPEGYSNPYYDVGFRFNLSELQKGSNNVGR
jgi:TonB family protein